MEKGASQQPEIDFTGGVRSEGLSQWHEQRRAYLRALAQELGLPLGHQVNVRLLDGIEVNGLLRLREDGLFVSDIPPGDLELVVHGVPFKAAEIESCVRTD